VEPEALVEYRYRVVCEVLGGSPIGEVAGRATARPGTRCTHGGSGLSRTG
jgi:hypothetical protein